MGRNWCSADWHGCGDPAFKVLDYLQSDDTLYYLGDAQDRGKDGIKLLDKLLTDPRVIYIKGNHDEMMAKAIPDAIERGIIHYYGMMWMNNGGRQTWHDIEYKSDKDKMWYVHKINNMPTQVIYQSPQGHDIILEHAGFSPFIKPLREHNPLWDRNHFHDEWCLGNYDFHDLNPEKTFLIHGHTPVQYLNYDYGYRGQEIIKSKDYFKAKYAFIADIDIEDYCPKPEVLCYCDGHKFDIDMCTISSGRIALMDMDTFEIIYFDKKD